MNITKKIGITFQELQQEVDECNQRVEELLDKWEADVIPDIPDETERDLAIRLDNKEGAIRELMEMIKHLEDIESDIKGLEKNGSK